MIERLLDVIALTSLLAATVAVGAELDPRIGRVENGLLPIAAKTVGVPDTITDRMRAYGVPGLSVAVIDGGKIAWARGYGISDMSSGRPVTTVTLFQAASISKPISAVGVLALVQRRRLDLDENVNRELRSWKLADNEFTRRAPVTIRMLLNHTAGVEHSDANNYVAFSMADRLPSLLEILRGEPPARAGAVRVMSVPGSTFAYSGAGYEVLQQLVTDVSGTSFEDYMQREVLQPIGMAHSTFSQPLPVSLLPAAASGHYAGGQGLPGRFRVSPELSVAGLWSTPTDIARYVINVQRSYEGVVQEPLNSDMTRQMLTPGSGGRGLGPAMAGNGKWLRFGHDGFNEGFEASFVGYIPQGKGAVVMANSGFAFMLIEEVLDSISRVYGWPDHGETTQRPPDADFRQQRVLPVPADMLSRSAGQYRLNDRLVLRIHPRKSRLFLDWPGNGSAEIFATAGGRFFCTPLWLSELGSPWLRFVTGPNGQVSKIVAGFGESIEMPRTD